MGLSETLAADKARRLTAARRQLLVSPVVHRADEPELFTTLLAFREELAAWFMTTFGWRLVVDNTGGFARLRKVAAQPDPTRPGRVRDSALNPRKYTLVFLACAALDEQPGQTTLSVLSEAVRELSAAEPAIRDFDPHNHHGDRLAFAGALKWLEALGIVSVREGDLDEYRDNAGANALLWVNDRLLAQLLTCPTSPAMVDDPADISAEIYPSGPDGQALRAGHQVRRRLADDPVVYYEDLSEDERSWFGPRWRLVNQLAADLGLAVERRAEGVAAIDVDPLRRGLSDVRFPQAGSTVSHAALLVAEHLAARHPRRAARVPLPAQPSLDDSLAAEPADAGAGGSFGGPGGEGGEGGDAQDEDRPPGEEQGGRPFLVSRSGIVAHLERCVAEYAHRCGWASWTTDAGGAERLTTEALERLAAFSLVRLVGDGSVVAPTPAVARFAAQAPDPTPRRS